MGYKVLIVIDHPKVKHQWWSDQRSHKTFAKAVQHRTAIAKKWSDCDTAILAPDGRVLAFRESINEEAAMKRAVSQ